MQKIEKADLAATERSPFVRPMVRLKGIGTAVPPHHLPQEEAARAAGRIFGERYPDFRRLAKVFQTAGIESRYSVCPVEWFEETQDWTERSERYQQGAGDLFINAAEAALADAGVTAAEIDTVVTVSSTGIATPTLEARAMGRMSFMPDVRRVPVFGLGCAGGVSGLGIAERLAATRPGTNVLLVCVETCTVAFRADRLCKADIIAATLFGDGAAALCVSSGEGDGPQLGESVEHTWPDTLNIMGWDVDEIGLGVIFDRSIPPFVEEYMRDAVTAGLDSMGFTSDDIHRCVMHPGGQKVIHAIEQSLSLVPGCLDHERSVLRDFGNMSSPTVLFVLERLLGDNPKGQMVMAALGPGFTLAMIPVLFDV